jgi:glycine/D-amino acid oxidase-like deaminating enzyme
MRPDPSVTRHSMPNSHWAAVSAQGMDFPTLAGDAAADVVVIGAGFTGLSTAIHLRERGIDVTVLEAAEPGYGASGRNNGQVIPTLSRLDPEDMIAKHGAAGERLASLVRDSATTLFDLVRRYTLEAEAEQTGWMQPAHTPGRLKVSEKRVRQWQAIGAPAQMLSRADVERMTGSTLWHGGWWNPTGGHINPLALAREMARKAAELGARIYAGTPAVTIAREGGHWVISTPKGKVKARALMLATHSYTAEFSKTLHPGLAREVLPVLSWQMATEPVGGNTRALVIPGRQAVSDTHGDLWFMRYDARHRLITGGALAVPVNGHERLKPLVAERLSRIYPQLGNITFSHVWNGYIGMTDDYSPRLHRIGPDAYAWAGCNGRGVALSVALGREFAAAIAGVPVDNLALPLTKVRPLPFHGVLRAVAPLMLVEYRRRDRKDM